MAISTHERATYRDVLIVDADVHAHDTPQALLSHVDPKWRPVVERLCQIPNRYLSVPGFSVSPPAVPGAGLPASPRGRVETVLTAEQMRRELDELGIDVGIVFPDYLLLIAGLANAEYADALGRAFHRWLDEEWLQEDNDLYGVIVATPQDPEAAAREIERWAGNERFAAVYLPVAQTYPLWGHYQYDPIFAAAEEADLPLILHSVSGYSSGFPFNVEQFRTEITIHTISHVFGMMSNMLSMLESGVPVRFPKLRVCFAEAGLTWVPFLRMRLDKEYNELRAQWAHFHDRPSKWIRQFYYATQPVEEPENRQDLVDIIRIYDGEETTVFASDWPHHDFDHPRAVFDLPVSLEIKRKIMGANALKMMPRITVPGRYQGIYAQGQGLLETVPSEQA